MDSAPIISIITPSYNRANELTHLYQSLKHQTVNLKLFEFIISDDGSTDHTKELVENWKKKSDLSIIFITQNKLLLFLDFRAFIFITQNN